MFSSSSWATWPWTSPFSLLDLYFHNGKKWGSWTRSEGKYSFLWATSQWLMGQFTALRGKDLKVYLSSAGRSAVSVSLSLSSLGVQHCLSRVWEPGSGNVRKHSRLCFFRWFLRSFLSCHLRSFKSWWKCKYRAQIQLQDPHPVLPTVGCPLTQTVPWNFRTPGTHSCTQQISLWPDLGSTEQHKFGMWIWWSWCGLGQAMRKDIGSWREVDGWGSQGPENSLVCLQCSAPGKRPPPDIQGEAWKWYREPHNSGLGSPRRPRASTHRPLWGADIRWTNFWGVRESLARRLHPTSEGLDFHWELFLPYFT